MQQHTTNEQLIEKFSSLFPSNERGTTFGFPSGRFKINTRGQKKFVWQYTTFRRAYRPLDVSQHLSKTVAIVASPFLSDGVSCRWAVIEIDDYALDFTDLQRRIDDLGLPLIVFRSKSGGPHLFVFFSEPRPAHLVRRLLKGGAGKLGFPTAEIFPKQDEIQDASKVGNNIQLPFFGDRSGLAQFEPRTYDLPPDRWELAPLETPTSSKYEGDDEPGYWEDDALKALLKSWSEAIPSFRFRALRNGFAVVCPGQLRGGWLDGSAHSDADKKRLDHETLVWIRNGWPVFRCVHAHCDAGVSGSEKKTWKDFVEFYDPLHLYFDYDVWLAAAMSVGEAEQYCPGGALCPK